MFNKNEWKKEIFKEDLKKVIISGLITAIIGGILAAIINYLFSLIHINVSISVFVYAILIGLFVKKGYVNYHILYPTLTILFMIIASIVSRFIYPFIVFFNFENYFNYLRSINSWLYIFFGPIYNLTKIGGNDSLYIIISFIIHFACYFISYRLAKGNN